MSTNSNEKYIPVNRAAITSNSYTPVNRAASLPKKKKSTLGKVASGIGDVAKAIVSPVATTVARPFQAIAMLGGASTEDIDKFTLGGLIAPTPKSGGDVIKDVGRSIQTVALGLPTTKATKLFGATVKPISSSVAPAMIGSSKLTPKAVKTANVLSKSVGLGTEGAIFGAGAGLEKGELGKNVAMGAGIGAALPIIGAGLSKAFGKTTSRGAGKVPEVIPETKVKTPTAKPTEEVIPTTKTVKANEVPVKVAPEQPIQRKISEVEYNEIKTKIENDYSDYDNFSKSDEFKDLDPEYVKQTYATRKATDVEIIANQGVDEVFDMVRGRGKTVLSPDSGTTLPSLKDSLIKSGKLTDEQIYRLLNSKAVESMAGSSLQSVSPLQSFINRANQAIKETYKRKIVANKKTVKNLFEGLECLD